MHDVMRKRLMRKLESLPDDQLYQVLDFIEFLESKYAGERAAEPSGFQRFAERFEDRLRARAASPRAINSAMGALSAAGRILTSVADTGRGVVDAGRELLGEAEAGARRRSRPPRQTPRGAADASGGEKDRPTIIPVE